LEIAVPDDTNPPRPPQPPEFERKFQLYPYQYILLPLIFLIPLLALFNVFGETHATHEAASSDVSVQVEYLSRSRHKLSAPIMVYITNQTDAALTDVTVQFDRDYIDAFLWLSFQPVVTAVTDDAYIVTIEEIPPGDTYGVTVDLKVEKIGSFAGMVTVEGDGLDPVSVRLESILFP
jgi:hypothetical protein